MAFNAELPYGATGTTFYAFGTAGTRNTIAGNNFRRANGLATLGQLFPVETWKMRWHFLSTTRCVLTFSA